MVKKWTKGQTMIFKTLHRKLKVEQQEPTKTNNDLQIIHRKLKVEQQEPH